MEKLFYMNNFCKIIYKFSFTTCTNKCMIFNGC